MFQFRTINSLIFRIAGLSLVGIFLAACGSANTESVPSELPPPAVKVIEATLTASATSTPLPTFTPSPTLTSTPTATPVWILNESGYAAVPILLYHHISNEQPFSRYYVGPEAFEEQMRSLRDWGYTTISMSLFLEALTVGADLPPRPIVITFDDGHSSVYEYAFPIMQEMGFIGINYIVGTRLEAENFMDSKQLLELQDAGWEVGGHSMTHADLTENHDSARYEILEPRLILEDIMGSDVDTFAYPFGAIDSFVADRVQDYGYSAGIGIGPSWEHTWGTLFYISRIEVYGGTDLAGFAAILPWSGPLVVAE